MPRSCARWASIGVRPRLIQTKRREWSASWWRISAALRSGNSGCKPLGGVVGVADDRGIGEQRGGIDVGGDEVAATVDDVGSDIGLVERFGTREARFGRAAGGKAQRLPGDGDEDAREHDIHQPEAGARQRDARRMGVPAARLVSVPGPVRHAAAAAIASWLAFAGRRSGGGDDLVLARFDRREADLAGERLDAIGAGEVGAFGAQHRNVEARLLDRPTCALTCSSRRRVS